MALTLRRVEVLRPILDSYKDELGIKTDTKAIEEIVLHYRLMKLKFDDMHKIATDQRRKIQQYEQVLRGLEVSLVPALELLKQQKMDI